MAGVQTREANPAISEHLPSCKQLTSLRHLEFNHQLTHQSITKQDGWSSQNGRHGFANSHSCYNRHATALPWNRVIPGRESVTNRSQKHQSKCQTLRNPSHIIKQHKDCNFWEPPKHPQLNLQASIQHHLYQLSSNEAYILAGWCLQPAAKMC